MNLDHLRASFLEQVGTEAEQAADDAERDHSSQLSDAHAEARRLVAEARKAGARDAAEEAARIDGAARRQARGHIFAARRELYEELLASALREAQSLRGDERYAALLERLISAARARLGPDAELDVDPAESGGVIARKGQRLVDYTLRALTERCIAALGPRAEELWR